MNVLKRSFFILFFSIAELVSSQSIEITNTQHLDLGTFSQYDDIGGTGTVSNTGSRSATGNITLIGATFSLAAFTITTDATDEFSLQIDRPTVSLSGSNGGSMSLQIGAAYPEFPSVENGSPATVYIGGTLTIGPSSANPSGTYSGNVLLYFNLHYE